MPKFIDLTGQTFGRLRVIERVENNRFGSSMFHCICSCGNSLVVAGNHLRSGSINSCGCIKREHKWNIKDLTGKTFNYLTVLRMADERLGDMKRIGWLCRCVCGAEVVVAGPNLENGGTKSCGCRRKQHGADTLIDITEQQFGNWTVIGRDESVTEGESYWLVQCSCGNVNSVSGSRLRSGKSQSCGCLRGKFASERNSIDITGQRFGTLTVLSRGNRNKFGQFKWVVQCDCGVIKEVTHVRTLKSCGCLTKEILSKAQTKHGMHGTREYKRAQGRKHRELSRLHDSEWTLEMDITLKEVFPTCVVCGMNDEEHRLKYEKSLTVDHVLPLSAGYGLKPGNAVVLCQHCNSVKNKRSMDKLPEPMRSRILNAAEYFFWYWNQPDRDIEPEYYEEGDE